MNAPSKLLVLVAVAAAVAACAPAVPSPQPESAVIGVRMRVFHPSNGEFDSPGSYKEVRYAERVFFVRLEGQDATGPGEVVPSNYTREGVVYLLGAKPGRYAAVAALVDQRHYRPPAPTPAQGVDPPDNDDNQGKFDYLSLLPEALIRKTVVEVAAGQVKYMGDYVVDYPDKIHRMQQADPTQLRYSEKFRYLFIHMSGIMVEGFADRLTEEAFLAKAHRHLAAIGWGELLGRPTAWRPAPLRQPAAG